VHDVLSPKYLISSFIIGTPVAVMAGSVAAVAFGIIGVGALAYSLYDSTVYEGALEVLNLAGYGVALVAIGLANPILGGIPISFIALSLTYDVKMPFGQREDSFDENAFRI
jgi:hypothetical protein